MFTSNIRRPKGTPLASMGSLDAIIGKTDRVGRLGRNDVVFHSVGHWFQPNL